MFLWKFELCSIMTMQNCKIQKKKLILFLIFLKQLLKVLSKSEVEMKLGRPTNLLITWYNKSLR
jgi:hypothetical protein